MRIGKNALFYKKLEDKLQCDLCPHRCTIEMDGTGVCGTRKNIDGHLITINYGRVAAYHLDPIEKKPLYHFYPGSYILSLGSFGCNFKCSFCQNYSIAHNKPDYIEVMPEKVVQILMEYENSIGIAFTYNEPTIWYEYIGDIAKEAKKINKKIVLVTNGYINKEPLKEILPLIDAMNIDLKAFTREFYKKQCKGDLKNVLETIEIASRSCHIEITTLLIETLNTSREEIKELSKWISSIDKSIPLHLSRYYPAYKMDLPPTSIEVMMGLRDLAKEYLDFVYIGNLPGVDNNTYCPQCNELLVNRRGNISIQGVKEGKCSNCNEKINLYY